MLLKYINLIKSSVSARYIHKYVFKMNKAYLRHIEEDNKFEISFEYTNLNLKVKRQFNLCRQTTENVAAFTARIATNLEKEIKKKNKSNQDLPPVTVSLIVNNQVITDQACKDVFATNNSILLKILEKEYTVIVNSPCVNALTLPKSIIANCLIYPTKFESIYTEKHLSDFKWYKSLNKTNWTLTGNSFLYEPTIADIDHFLKIQCTPKNETLEGPTIEAVSSVKVSPGPGPFPFEKRHQFTKTRCTEPAFRVVTYNILADLYCDMEYTRTVLHPYCPVEALQLDYRKQLFTKELIGYNADIICLQEVDRKVFKHDLQPVFDHLGYDSDFCIKKGAVAEGLACFFNRTRFLKLDSVRFVPSEEIQTNPLFAELLAKLQSKPSLFERFEDRSTVLQVNILQSKEEILIVANTHLYFHPDADHIRLLQAGINVKFLENLKNSLKSQNEATGRRVSLVFCGDFNSVPECGVFKLYTGGAVDEHHSDFKSNAEEAVEGVSLQQSLHLASACGTPEFTNFTAGFAACLDYIFYETDNLEVVQSVPLPSNAELAENVALPSVVFASDHVSLCSDLKFK